MPKQDKTSWAKLGEYTSLGMLLPSCVFVGYAIGYLLDKWLGTTYLYLVFLILGIIGGFVELLRKANQLFKDQ